MVEVISNRKLSEEELNNIKDIMANSQCPNESLSNSIDGYKEMITTTETIVIGDEEGRFLYKV